MAIGFLASRDYLQLFPTSGLHDTLASRMAFDAYGETDLFALGLFALALVIAYALGGLSNFFLLLSI